MVGRGLDCFFSKGAASPNAIDSDSSKSFSGDWSRRGEVRWKHVGCVTCKDERKAWEGCSKATKRLATKTIHMLIGRGEIIFSNTEDVCASSGAHRHRHIAS